MPTNKSIIQARYDAKNAKIYTMKFNRKTDADIIEKLDSITTSRQDYIRKLIREDIARTRAVSNLEINTAIDKVLPVPEITELSDEKHIYTADKLESFEQAIEAVKKQK